MITTETIINSIVSVEKLYSKMIILTGHSNEQKNQLISKLSKELQVDPINLNLELSSNLLHLTHRQRILKIGDILDELLKMSGERTILKHAEILFDPSLEQDPLRLLQHCSRNRTIIIDWNGKVEDGKLVYAKPEHPEYRSYPIEGLTIIETDKEF